MVQDILQKALKEKWPSITVAFLGDSVTHGCFEVYRTSPDDLDTVYEYKSAYSTRFKEIMNILYPSLRVNIINAGISGDKSAVGEQRLDKDILSFHPDLVVVSYGLNDSATLGKDRVNEFGDTLCRIFDKIKKSGSEVLFITQNYMNTKVSPRQNDPSFAPMAERFAKIQNDGVLKLFFSKAKESAQKCGAEVLDLYSVWEKMEEKGVDVTELLANKLNHPIREYHYYMAIKLVEKMIGA